MSETRNPGKDEICRPLAYESPIRLSVNGKDETVLFGTPENMDELAIGYLYTRGMLEDIGAIETLEVRRDRKEVAVSANPPLKKGTLELSRIILSENGATPEYSPAFLSLPPIRAEWKIELDRLKKWARAMFDSATVYHRTGGVHCACLAAGSGELYIREDVGRHNAIDKVVGRGLMEGVDFSRCCLLSSGRIASDMILKAYAAGIPVVVTRSIPTTSAFEIAKLKALTLVGRIERDSPLLYTHEYRILR